MGESFPMNGGDSAYSYAKHSHLQKLGCDSVKDMIREAIHENLDAEKVLSSSSSAIVRIADLGCSIGPNTFSTVQNLIESIRNKHGSSLEFQVLFSDHSANDFNTLFASLPPERPYHAAGVPGSFHGRLFPSGSIAVAHSSFALHWLSKQPELRLPNEGRIFHTGAAPHVAGAYADQFATDLASFMSARADEIVSGGLLLLIIPFTSDELIRQSELGPSLLLDFLGDCLMDLANQGEVERSAVDAFNFPMYFPTKGEMRKGVEENGRFSIERIELTNPRAKIEGGAIDAASMVIVLRAATEGVLTAHFGNPVVEKLFDCMLKRTAEISKSIEASSRYPYQMLVVLKRN